MAAPSKAAKSNQRTKKRKKREMDPLKLVLERGMNTITKTDDEGNERIEFRPKGVVLAPMQTMMLASFIQQQQQTIEMLMADDEDDEEDTDQEADKEE